MMFLGGSCPTSDFWWARAQQLRRQRLLSMAARPFVTAIARDRRRHPSSTSRYRIFARDIRNEFRRLTEGENL